MENFAFGKEIRIYGIKDWIVSKAHEHLQESNRFYTRQVKVMEQSELPVCFYQFIAALKPSSLYSSTIRKIVKLTWDGVEGRSEHMSIADKVEPFFSVVQPFVAVHMPVWS